jgi:hypothetical protein
VNKRIKNKFINSFQVKIYTTHFVLIAMLIISCNKNDSTAVPDPAKKKWIVTTVAGDGYSAL